MTSSRAGAAVIGVAALWMASIAGAAGAASVDAPEFVAAWNTIHGDAIAQHVKVLASDAYEGRSPGTAGEESTLAYVTAAFKGAGLAPWRAAGYAQDVPLDVTTVVGLPTFALHVGELRLAPALKDAYLPRLAHPAARVDIAASPLVFAGHGTVAPEFGWDDYAGVDLKGKTVILLYGPPGGSGADSALFAAGGSRYGMGASKYAEAAKRGARAALVVHTDESAGFPWSTIAGGGVGRSQYFLAPEAATPELEAVVNLSAPAARALFAACGLDLDAEIRAASVRGFRAHALKATADLAMRADVRHIRSHNLIGVVPGTGAPDEAVVLMAHWDHMGRDTTLKGDQIFNGAVDNATGVASLIEIARAFHAVGHAPRRTVVLVATTAEERGLLGSEYLARHPVRPLARTAAAIALDAFFPYANWPAMTMTGHGESDLDSVLALSCARLGRKLQGDDQPQLGAFYRADHYPWCKRGVPGFLAVGNPDEASTDTADVAVKALTDYVTTKYHHVGDEYDASWNMQGIEGDARTLFEFAWRVADETGWPQWRPTSSYRVLGDGLRAQR